MLKRVLPHISIACSLILLILYIINLFNDAMGFLRGSEFEFLLLISIIASFFTAVYLVRENWLSDKRKNRDSSRRY